MYVKQLIDILKQYEQDDEVKVRTLVSIKDIDEDDKSKGYIIVDADIIDFDGDEYPTIMAQDEDYNEKYIEEQ